MVAQGTYLILIGSNLNRAAVIFSMKSECFTYQDSAAIASLSTQSTPQPQQ
jgi:hypothetical protein